jgi:aryl-alcohol dehydrogenase-like predicted oxidoreductase
MKMRRIGSLEVTDVGLGCNNFGWRVGPEASAEVIEAALEAGVNFFDTADMYGEGRSETFLGETLGTRRKNVIVATKFANKMGDGKEGASAAYVKEAVEASLKRLQTDYIDLYQQHRPDPKTPIEETLGALDDLVREGKVREIGCSNFSAEQIREADSAAAQNARFVSVQNDYSLFRRDPEKDVLAECEARDLAFLPYFPLANGLLTGKYRLGHAFPRGSRAVDAFGPKVFTEQNLRTVESLIRFAESRGHTVLELAFAWLLANPVIASVIAGAKTPEQLRQNARSDSWELSASDLAEIDSIMVAGQPEGTPVG